ncbi:hypothetical protein H7097_01015 [Aeromicrobium sp.]|nr:hypothetical protein [Candidatus Saccharibacteria bacterium]
MNTAEQILVILVSSLLSITLIIGIVVLIVAYKVIKSIQRIAEKGEQVIENAEHATEVFTKAAGPMSLFRSITNVVEAVNKHKKGK